MIKPDATSKGHTGAILDQIIKAGFTIKAMKWTRLTTEQAGQFYEIHKERPVYGELILHRPTREPSVKTLLLL